MKTKKTRVIEFLGIVVYGITVFLTVMAGSFLVSYWILEEIR